MVHLIDVNNCNIFNFYHAPAFLLINAVDSIACMQYQRFVQEKRLVSIIQKLIRRHIIDYELGINVLDGRIEKRNRSTNQKICRQITCIVKKKKWLSYC
jgi:hypothetical protein